MNINEDKLAAEKDNGANKEHYIKGRKRDKKEKEANKQKKEVEKTSCLYFPHQQLLEKYGFGFLRGLLSRSVFDFQSLNISIVWTIRRHIEVSILQI